MNTLFHPLRSLRYLGAALLLTAGLSACSTGTESGDTNVETGHDKYPRNPGAQTANDGIDSGRVQREGAVSEQERMYQNGSERQDHDNDGKADQ
ncbi:hypothetical protein EJV47_00495 [Hymenobacter gummosus]|uniref:Lipoprotein n=1 Tax=Hymenobacter gummosus TaxID=1776032 RepID=A0A3S0HR48_9BACT|nr:hypothetical protein [Hymenobacter gummosus]RTQ53254.1 hypothetical protein EJV47_00495 [Hymenobacter gummosus]